MDLNHEVPQSAFNTQHDAMLRFLERNDVESFLYRHQVDAVKAVRERFRLSKIALVVLPTGCGKSGVAVLVPYAINASKVLVITPSLAISKQIYEDFRGKEKMFLYRREMLRNEDDIEKATPQGKLISRTGELGDALDCPLVVANAQKFGTNTNIDIQKIPRNNFDLVIVDEAHHYPAITWKRIVNHFPNSRRLFLTATPYHNGDNFILPGHRPCYELTQRTAVQLGIIRNIKFEEQQADQQGNAPYYEIMSQNIRRFLNQHDRNDPLPRNQPQDGPAQCHQAMVITTTIDEANRFADTYNALFPSDLPCASYHSESHDQKVLEEFQNFQIRVLVVVKKLLEGFDRKYISVVGIARRVAPTSKVLFTQFVGRAVRKLRNGDPVCAMVVSHTHYKQRRNFDRFDLIAEEDPIDDDQPIVPALEDMDLT